MATSNIKGYVPDLSGLNKQARAAIEKGVNDGLFCTDVVEALPNRERGGCEKVIKGRNNAWIVLGRDRPTSIVSGAGGAGQTQCGMIDMVVGLAAGESIKKMKKGDNPKGPDDVVSPNFGSDAARLYMSQRCPGNGGIDGYLGLTRVKGPSAMNKSAIAMKADHVRIVGRECVRIYASRGQNFQGFGIGGEKTTLGTAISNSRIDLVAGREEDLQPAVLGNNLKQYLEQKDDAVTEILRTIINMTIQLIEVNTTVMFMNPALAKNIPKNINDLWSMIIQTLNNQIEKINSLDMLIMSGGNPLLSNTVFIT